VPRGDTGKIDLAGRRAIVARAAVGTGRAIAARLAAEGAFVVAADVDEARGQGAVARTAAAGERRLDRRGSASRRTSRPSTPPRRPA
jgi:NAD(P)-dependent dehydrogenase (short-subunit alcohol dehydrogenase family)